MERVSNQRITRKEENKGGADASKTGSKLDVMMARQLIPL